MEEKRKKLLDSILKESYKMVDEKTWPVTEDELVEHTGIGGSFDFGFLCGYLHCKEEMMKDAIDATIHPYDKEIWVDDNKIEQYDEFEKVKIMVIGKEEE